MNSKLIVFLDNIQRTIIATVVQETSDVLVVTMPAVLNVVPANEKKLQVQLYPLLFREFHKDRDVFPQWRYYKTQIAVAEGFELEGNLVKQYEEMFKPTPKAEPAPTIKLFDNK